MYRLGTFQNISYDMTKYDMDVYSFTLRLNFRSMTTLQKKIYDFNGE